MPADEILVYEVIDVRPARDPRFARNGCGEVFEGDGVSPVFPPPNARDKALSYATQRADYSPTEIRVLDDKGNVVETIGNEEARPLV